MKTYFSNRIYKNKIDAIAVLSIEHALLLFGQAKQFAFSTQVKEKRSGHSRREESMFLTVKKKYQLNDYYTNSAVQEAKALFSSCEELTKLYINEKEEKVKTIKKKIKATKSRLTVLRKIKQSIIKGKPTFNQTSREQKRGNYFVVEYKKQTDLYYDLYAFEHFYLESEMKRLRQRIGLLTFRLNRTLQKIQSLKTTTRSVVFGTKKLFKYQFTKPEYIKKHEKWKQEYIHARYNQMTISGRKDAKYGNFVFQYNSETHVLSFQTPNGTPVQFQGLVFPYGQEQVNQAIEKQINCKNKKQFGKPIAWGIEDHKEYYLVKCMVQEEVNEHINYSKSDGVIGIDCNVDHFAVSNVNEIGQLVDSFVQHFDLTGKTSNQITKLIENEVIALVNYAVKHHKPIAVERLDTTISKGKNIYGNKKANARMSLFAYRKMLDAIKSRAAKMGVAVFEVNPAYTSQIGKMKYMKKLGVSIHQAAAYVIARRAMGYKETLPPVLHSLLPEKIVGLHHWVHWKHSMNLLKGVRTHAFYQSELFDFAKFCVSHELFPPCALTDEERKGLAKIGQ